MGHGVLSVRKPLHGTAKATGSGKEPGLAKNWQNDTAGRQQKTTELQKAVMQTLHIVLDIETLGNFYGAAIIDVGAAAFVCHDDKADKFPDDRLWTFSRAVNLEQSQRLGFEAAEFNTRWWQCHFPDTLAAILEEGNRDAKYSSPASVLNAFNAWVKQLPRCSRKFFWGNGPEYDMVLMSAYYRLLHIQPPWNFMELASMRSLKALCHDFAPGFVNETPHRGMTDAVHEAKSLREFLRTRIAGTAAGTAKD